MTIPKASIRPKRRKVSILILRQRQQRIDDVNQVIELIDATDVPQIEVYNKIDTLEDPPAVRCDQAPNGVVNRVWVSACEPRGLDELRAAIAARLGENQISMTVHLNAGDGRLRAKLFQLGQVLRERISEDGSSELDVVIVAAYAKRLQKHDGLEVVSALSGLATGDAIADRGTPLT